MELDVWSGNWGLASVDFSSLQAMAIVKFAGVPVKINKTNNPFWAPNGRLPVFRHFKQQLFSCRDIASYLYSKNFSPDPGLDQKQLSEIVAYEEMMKEKLYPALMYVMWIESKNYLEVTRPWYAKVLPFPFNYFYPGHYQRLNTSLISSLYPHLTESERKAKIFSEAEKCLACLSKRLGESDFYYGQHPSTLDAMVFGYIAPLLKMPFPSNPLNNHLVSSSNLVKFVVRINQRYFPSDYQDYESKRQKESETGKKPSDTTFPNKTRNQILAGIFATVAMVSYALKNGIFSISVNSDPYSQIEYEFDEEEN